LSRAVGIRPQPDQVADEVAIRGLAHAFADAVNRKDAAAFESLWDDNGEWEIGDPLPSIAKGSSNIAAQLLKLWDALEFFVQQVHSGVVSIDGDRATSRWSVQETGLGWYFLDSLFSDIDSPSLRRNPQHCSWVSSLPRKTISFCRLLLSRGRDDSHICSIGLPPQPSVDAKAA